MPSDGPSSSPPEGSGTTPTIDTARDARTVSGLTMVSRVFGLARDAALARVLGDTPIASAFAAAFIIPNLLRRLFGEGALAAAFLPEYARAGADREGLARIVILRTGVITTGLTIVGELALLALLLALPRDADRDLSIRLAMLLLPFMPMVCAAAALGAMLQARGKFAVAAASPILLNIMMIVPASMHLALAGAGRSPDPRETVIWVSLSVLLAGVAQLLWSWRALGSGSLAQGGVRARARSRRVMRRLGPAALGLGVVQLNTLGDTVIAMWPIWVGPSILGFKYPLDASSNAVLFFSQRLYQFPLGVFGVAIAIAAFPALSRAARDTLRFSRALTDATRLSLAIALPAGVGLVLVGTDLCATILAGGGGFSDEGVIRAGAVLTGYAAGLWAYGLNQVLTRAFYARGEMRTPVRIAWICVGVNLLGNLILIWPLGEAGLAWSTALSATLQWALLRRALARRDPGALAPAGDDSPARTGVVPRLILATGIMAGAVFALLYLLPEATGWSRHAIRLVCATAVGVGVYALACQILGVQELRRLIFVRSPRRGDG